LYHPPHKCRISCKKHPKLILVLNQKGNNLCQTRGYGFSFTDNGGSNHDWNKGSNAPSLGKEGGGGGRERASTAPSKRSGSSKSNAYDQKMSPSNISPNQTTLPPLQSLNLLQTSPLQQQHHIQPPVRLSSDIPQTQTTTSSKRVPVVLQLTANLLQTYTNINAVTSRAFFFHFLVLFLHGFSRSLP